MNSCATQPDNSFSYLFEGRVTMSFNHFSTSLEVYSCVQLHILVTHFGYTFFLLTLFAKVANNLITIFTNTEYNYYQLSHLTYKLHF
jgi:hypothetical protein